MVGPQVHFPTQSRGIRRRLAAAITSAALIATVGIVPAVHAATPFVIGDVMAGVGDGSVKQFDPTGTLKNTLVGTSSTYTTGMAFDSAGNMYVSDFGSGTVDKYDNNGNFLGAFITGITGDPESLAFDAAGNLYVGRADGTDVQKYDSTGAFVTSYPVATEARGSDWIDLAADQCTLFYTSEGDLVKRFDICTNTQLADFATLPTGEAYALRIRPNGDVIVAATGFAYRLDSAGALVQTYTIPGANLLFAMNLDPDGLSFWTGDLNSGDINRIDISTGTVITTFNSSPFTVLGGLAVVGELRVATGNTAVSYTGPASVQYSDSLTLSGHLQTSPGGLPIAGENLGFVLGTDSKTAGPTNALGNASTAPYQELQKPGSATSVTVSFAGDTTTNPKLGPSSSTADFTIAKEDCTVAYTGDILVNAANPTTLSAQFGELDSSPGDWAGKLITFTVTDAALNTYGPYTATTNSAGVASTSQNLGPNVYSVNVSFAGDDYYLKCASATDTIVTVESANAKITGGGWISQGTGKTNFGFNVIRDVTGLKGQLQVRVRSGKDKFHSTSVLTLNSSGNSGTWTGTGRWNGVTGYTFTVSVVDNGTSGKKGDTISIVIKSPTNATVFTTSGAQPLKGGNIVVH